MLNTKYFVASIAVAFAALTSTAQAMNSANPNLVVCNLIKGATLVASDGTFLGNLTAASDPKSIKNKSGQYGGIYGKNSIFNTYSPYGGLMSQKSPFTPNAATPPSIMKNGAVIGYLTVNQKMPTGIQPTTLKLCYW